MYKIKRKYYSKKQKWLINLLFLMDPKLFQCYKDKETCQANLATILDIIEQSKLDWHRGHFNLSYMRLIHKSDDEILIVKKGGERSFAFKIESV